MSKSSIDPNCPSDTDTPIIPILHVLAWLYLAGSLAAAAWLGYYLPRQQTAALGLLGVGEEAAPLVMMYRVGALGLVLQGALWCVGMEALASIVGSLLGIRISSRATARATAEVLSVSQRESV